MKKNIIVVLFLILVVKIDAQISKEELIGEWESVLDSLSHTETIVLKESGIGSVSTSLIFKESALKGKSKRKARKKNNKRALQLYFEVKKWELKNDTLVLLKISEINTGKDNSVKWMYVIKELGENHFIAQTINGISNEIIYPDKLKFIKQN